MTTQNDHKTKTPIEPSSKHLSTPIKSTQDLMKTILDEISPSTHLPFSPSELELSNTIYTLIKDLFQQTNLSYLKYYLTHKPIYHSSINRTKCLQILFFILSRFYNKIFIYEKGFEFFTSINNIIIRLYIDSHLTLSDIELIIKFYFTLSCLNMNDNLMGMRNCNIKNYEFIEIAFTLLINVFVRYNNNSELSHEEQHVIVSILNYFKRKFINSNYINIVYLTNPLYLNKINVFDLLHLLLKNPFKLQEQIENDIVYNEIKSLFIAIYKYHFSYEKFMLPILNIMKDILVNFNAHSLSQLKYNFQRVNFIIQYLHDVSFEENKSSRADMCNVSNTFYFGKKDAGLLLKPSKIINDNITIVFSFKLTARPKKEKYIVIGFSTEKISLCLLLERNADNESEFKFMMRMSGMKKDDVVDMQIRVNENKTYVYALNLSRNYIELQSNNKQHHYKCSSNGFNISTGSQVYVGYHPREDVKQERTFSGFIGTVIGLTKVDSDYVSKILTLKGEYEYILYNSKYVFDESNTDIKKAALHNDIARYLLETKSQEHIAFIISPQVFQLKKPKDIYSKTIKTNMSINAYHRTRTRSSRTSSPDKVNKVYYNEHSNFLNLDSSMLVGQSIETTSSFDQKFNICVLKKTLREFVKSDGLKYISLIFEYYYQIMLLYKTQKRNELSEVIKLM